MTPIRRISARSAGQFFAIVATICAVAYALYGGFAGPIANLMVLAAAIAIATCASALTRAAAPDRAMMLQRGHLHALRGPELFGINPVIAASSAMFWKVFDPATVAFSQGARVASHPPGPDLRGDFRSRNFMPPDVRPRPAVDRRAIP